MYDFGHHQNYLEKAVVKYYGLWFTYGESYGKYDGVYKMKGSTVRQNILFASEPLTQDTTTWIEVPEYSLVTAQFVDNEIEVRTHDLNV